jgi:hypothetical protein
MKKVLIGVVTAGAILGLGAGARRLGKKMRQHCEQMMGQFRGRSEPVAKT